MELIPEFVSGVFLGLYSERLTKDYIPTDKDLERKTRLAEISALWTERYKEGRNPEEYAKFQAKYQEEVQQLRGGVESLFLIKSESPIVSGAS